MERRRKKEGRTTRKEKKGNIRNGRGYFINYPHGKKYFAINISAVVGKEERKRHEEKKFCLVVNILDTQCKRFIFLFFVFQRKTEKCEEDIVQVNVTVIESIVVLSPELNKYLSVYCT